MNAELLQLLATELRCWPSVQFDYGSWVGKDWKGKTDLSCGTTACALGVATTMPVFQKLGLKLATDTRGNGYVAIEGVPPTKWEDYGTDDVCSLETSLRSAMVIFDVSKGEATYLFNPETSPYVMVDVPPETELKRSPFKQAIPIQVAEHIEAFIKFKQGE